MKANQNIGDWNAVVENIGKTPQLVVNGTFPTFGQKPFLSLRKKEPQGIIETELVLRLIFVTPANTEGSVFFSVGQSYPIEHTDKYKTVLVADENERTITNEVGKSQKMFDIVKQAGGKYRKYANLN